MYARFMTFNINPGHVSNARSFAEIFKHRLESYDGFVSIEFFYNPDTNTAKSLSKWESKEQANAELSASLETAAKSFGSGEFSINAFNTYPIAA